ncbi:amidase [Bradyrhizobium sp. LHD-71]|uniref:amidase n=1 Tax=Bradyrhizobium sp. LHD-71 TaxID=3072141 RepID=UPI00280DCA63|nr:amidase [Bradyrhizobium sp. LHD-71]MDQ8726646.1 amidase [Bradyrhizobium sp. LHD-71]
MHTRLQPSPEPCFLTAAEAATRIREGRLTSETLIRSCIERIEARDPLVKAWLYLDKAQAIATARELDKRPSLGALHGLPIGVKDMIDTADMPTTYNSPVFQHHRPARDAACVAVARLSGAVILGKTDTVEFAAAGRRAATRNPKNFAHTPGGSSSGSGAAVGDRQVQLAFGTQTGGSHIRPASFNGIYGLKPTWGSVSREGAKQYSNMLDTIGWYGRSVDDLALVASAFRLHAVGEVAVPEASALRVAYCRTPFWEKIEPAGERAFAVACDRLASAGVKLTELTLPRPFGGMFEAQNTIMMGEGRASFLDAALEFGDRLHQDFHDRVENKPGITPTAMIAAYDLAAACRREFEALFANFDAVLAPASPGEAPEGSYNTGDHVFNAMWTLLHVPCIGIPCMTGPKGLPVGVQIVAPRYSDARLLATAAALAPIIDQETARYVADA